MAPIYIAIFDRRPAAGKRRARAVTRRHGVTNIHHGNTTTGKRNASVANHANATARLVRQAPSEPTIHARRFSIREPLYRVPQTGNLPPAYVCYFSGRVRFYLFIDRIILTLKP
ncbi:hypothetical protein AB4851_09210 [Burkholderia sp. 22PA0099]|uniref:hypothetical protein n=1 Tax=Burkholderia sp. 22PA0099 TaxID=3237372 RepID=UPI0039C0E9F0